MDSVLQKVAELKKGKVYQSKTVSSTHYRIKENTGTGLDDFGDEDDWNETGSWNYVSILEKFDEEKEEIGTLPTLSFLPSSKLLLGYIDLNTLEVLDRDSGVKKFAQTMMTVNEQPQNQTEEDYSGLPIMPCRHPVGFFHLTIVLHPEQNLPQVIGPDVVQDIFLVAGIFLPESGAMIGFNSLNAGAPSNRLHIELLLSPSFGTPAGVITEEPGWPSSLPALSSKGEMLFMGKLTGPDEYTDYSVLVELTRHTNCPHPFLKLELKDVTQPEDGDQFDWASVHASILSFAISELTGLRLPHNLVWMNSGRTVLIFPRVTDLTYAKWGWTEMVGLNRYSDLPKPSSTSDPQQFLEICEGFKAVLTQMLLADCNEPN